ELVTVRVSAVRSDPRATVPAMVSVANRWPAPRVIVPLSPVKVTADPIDVRLAAEEVSHDPAMEIVEVPRLRTARPFEVRLPSEVIVNVVVEEPLSNSTVLNSLPAKLAPANVIVWSVVALNVTTADPADQDAEVEAFVQFPETIQVSEPNAM